MIIRFIALLMLLGTAGCGSSGDEDYGLDDTPPPTLANIPNKAPIQQPTALNCPTGTFLTYANFGASFLNKYCNSCHAADVPKEKRAGAPLTANFDTASDAILWRNAILARATGPAASMPPAGKPAASDQAALTEWLGCGAPK